MKRVAVIGGGLGGLTAAGELARAGHAVTLFERSDTLGGKAQTFSADGLRFDTGPTLLTMPDTVRQTFQRLGAEGLLPRFHRLPLQTEYRFADGRAFSCWEALEQAMASAATFGEAEGFASFTREAERIYRAAGEPYLEAPYDGLGAFIGRALKRGVGTMLTGLKLSTLDGLARKHFRTPQLQQFVGRFATYTGGSPWESSAAFAMIPHIERAFGTHHVEGGMGALVRALETAVRSLGVQIQLRATVSPASLLEGKRDAPFVIHDTAFDAVVSNQDPLTVLDRSTEPRAMSGYVFFVEAEGAPRLPHHLILFSSDYRGEFRELFSGVVPTEPTVYVCNPGATDATMAPEGRTGLFIMVNVPAFEDEAAARASWPAEATRLQQFCLERLRAHFSDLGPLRVLGQRTPLDLAERGAPGGSIYGYLPHGKFGPFRRPALRGPRPGYFFAGGGTHPGGGVPLVMLSGHFAATLAHAHLEGA